MHLAPVLEGRRFEAVRIHDVRLTRPLDPAEVAAGLEGEGVASVDRRGKYLVVRFDSGRTLLIHLRMTGTLLHGRNGTAPDDPYVRAVVRLDNGSDVAYRDVRRFGTWLAARARRARTRISLRGSAMSRSARVSPGTPSPIGCAGGGLRSRGRCSTSGPWPGWGTSTRTRRSGRRRSTRCARPGRSTPTTSRACTRQSAPLSSPESSTREPRCSDYRLPTGETGGMQREFQVYGREGEACPRCGTPIERTVVAGRGTSFCPRCQRQPRRRTTPRR